MFLSTDKNRGLHNFQYALKTYLSRKAKSEVTALMYSNSYIHRNIVESGIKYPTPLQFHYFEVFWVIILYILWKFFVIVSCCNRVHWHGRGLVTNINEAGGLGCISRPPEATDILSKENTYVFVLKRDVMAYLNNITIQIWMIVPLPLSMQE